MGTRGVLVCVFTILLAACQAPDEPTSPPTHETATGPAESGFPTITLLGEPEVLYFSRMDGSRTAENMDLLRLPVRIDK